MKPNIVGASLNAAALNDLLPALRKYFQRRVSRQYAEDLVQDVCVNLQARKSDRPIENAEAYMFTVARHVLARHLRREATLFLSDSALEIENVHDAAPLPDKQLQDKEDLSHVLTAIEEMPSRTRDIFIMHRFENMTYSEIARQFGVSTSAIEKHIMAALRTLIQVSGAVR